MKYALKSVGYFVSGLGGAQNPSTIVPGEIVFEMIVAGSVFSPTGDQIRGVGWIFCHHAGEQTIWKSPDGEHYECLTLHFKDFMEPAEEWPRSFFWDDSEAVTNFSHEILAAFHHTDVPKDILGDLIWSTLRFRLYSYLRQEERHEVPERISTVMTYIERFHAKDLSIEELADQVSLSPSHLHTIFREFVGMSPHQYVIEQRMRMTRHLLVTTSDPIKDIARAVGYVNAESFSRAFKRHYKTTAAAYRRKYTIQSR